MELLPHYDVTPALEMFLYGPNDYGKAALRNPQGMTLMGDKLLVCDQGRPDVVVIDLPTGQSLPLTDIDRRPRCPVAVAADAACVYVADTTSRCVVIYDPRGRLLEELAPTTDPNRKFRPISVLIHKGVLYIGDMPDRPWTKDIHPAVARFDLNTRQWLTPIVPPPDQKKLIAPAGLDMTAEGTLLIVDAVQGQVFRLDSDGEWLRPIGKPGRLAGEFVRPKQVCHTPSGHILVADAGRQSVLMFDPDGKYVLEIHETNGDWRGFTLPMGLLSLPANCIPPAVLQAHDTPLQAIEYVIVSDELGGMPLTLLGLVTRQPPREVAHAR